MSKQDALIDATWTALQRWDEAERQARDLRSITKADVRRADRLSDGSRIPTPRRNALTRYIVDANLTALREYEAEAFPRALHDWRAKQTLAGCGWKFDSVANGVRLCPCRADAMAILALVAR